MRRKFFRRGMSLFILISILLLMSLLIPEVGGFGRPRKSYRKSKGFNKHCEPTEKSNNVLAENFQTERPEEIKTIDYNPYYNCGLAGFGVVQKIPYAAPISGSALNVALSSGCVRCGMCLAIAERINQTLVIVHDGMLQNQWLENDEANLLLRFVCDDQFKHFALREIDGERFLGDGLPGAVLITTTADGSWEKMFKKKCHKILDEVGTQELYKHWRDWCENLENRIVDFLCRGDSGDLRDCYNIDGDGKKPEACQHIYHADVKAQGEIGE